MNEPPSSASSSALGPAGDPAEGYGASSAPPQADQPEMDTDGGTPQEAPGIPPRGRLEESTADPATLQAAARLATEAEVGKSLRIAAALAVPVMALIALAAFRAAQGSTLERESLWVSGHLALLMLLVAGQLVCALLVREHWRTIEEIVTSRGQPGAGRAGRWVAFAAVVGFVLLTLLAGRVPLTEWVQVAVAGVVVELVAVAVVLAARQRFAVHSAGLTESEPPSLESLDLDEDLLEPPKPEELVAVGASGGGIRAAAFVLGGINALQNAPRYRDQASEPEVFAVSGGSYTAASLALRRRFSDDWSHDSGTEPGTRVGWRGAFTLDSPELDYLRRHTRYLFEPRSSLRDGAVSLLVGAAVNLFVVAAMLRALAWFSAQLAVTSGVLGFSQGRPDLGGSRLLAVVIGVAGTVVAVASFLRWAIHAKFDRGADADGTDIARMGALSTVRTGALAGAAALVLLIAIPAATTALVDAVATNRPTAAIAGVLKSSGFGTTAICEQAMVERVTEALAEAEQRARLSPGVARSVNTGACGVSVSVSQTVRPGDDTGTADDVIAGIDPERARALTQGVSTPIQIGTILALLGSVVGLLARGPAADAAREGGWFARLKRRVVTWVPLIITISIGLYLLLLWHLHFLLGIGLARFVLPNAAFLVLAGVLAFFLDANNTSMHQFYRERLSNAFAVGVDAAGVADELAAERIYRFSDLVGGPRLNVVTTLNTQAPHEVPTLRGGKPLVFGRRYVDLNETRGLATRIPTSDYESFAGPGRTSIMATVAMSGAAISPLMGRYAGQMKPYRILLTLFNLRVGMWMLNPTHTMLVDGGPPGHRDRLSVTARPGPAQVALEAVGKSSAGDRWVYISDGGHLDNTAMVECVRHALHRTPRGQPLRGQVVVLDASNDPPGAWSAVGDALNVIRADLRIDLVRKFTPGEPPWLRQFVELAADGVPGNERFGVIVVKAVRVEPPAEGSTDWHRRLPEPVKSIQILRPDFPRSSTARQRFGDLEFEAYRAYGFAAVSLALAFLDDPPRPERARPRSLTKASRGRLRR